jgi:hypothetical protein
VKRFLYVKDATLQVVSESFLPSAPSYIPEGCSVVEIPVGMAVPPNSTFADGAVIPPPPPTDAELVTEARTAAWSRTKAFRQSLLTLPVTVGTLTFDATEVSQARILAAIQMADLVGPAWSATWTLADNSSAEVDRATLAAVVVAVGVRTDGIFAQARTLREQIDAAQTVAEVEAVVWPPES